MNGSLANSLTPFSGAEGENVAFFIKNLTDLALIENWTELQKTWMLRNKLSGKAAEFINNDPSMVNVNDFDDLCNALQTKFSKSKNLLDLQKQFSNIKHQPNQSVDDLAKEINNIVQKYIPNPRDSLEIEVIRSNTKFSKFMETLRNDIRVELQKFGPKNFEDAVERAKNIESALNSMSFDLNTIQSQPSTSHDSCRKQLEEYKQQLGHLNKTISKLMEQRVICHICGKGHLTTECFQFLSTSNQHAPQSNQNANSCTNFRNFRGRSQRGHPYSRKFFKRNNKS